MSNLAARDTWFARGGVLLVALGAATWGTDTVLRAPLYAALAPVLVVLGEHVILSFYSVPAIFRRWRELRRLGARDWAALGFVGWGGSAAATVLFTVGLFEAYRSGGSSVNTVFLLQQTQPLFAVLAAAIVLHEKPSARYVPIFITGVTGAYLLAFGEQGWHLLTPFTQVGQAHLKFALIGISAAFLWGTSTSLGRFVSYKLSFPTLTGARFLVALPFLLVWAIIAVPDLPGAFAHGIVQPDAARNLVLLALFPGLIGLLIYYRGLRETPASYATLAELAYPMTGVLLNWIVLGQPLVALQALGVVLVLVAITLMRTGKAAVRDEPQPAH